MKRYIAILIILAVFFAASAGGVVSGTAYYTVDIKDHWLGTAIEGNPELSLLVDNDELLFYPEKPITREEFRVMLNKVLPDKYQQSLTGEGHISRDEAVELVADCIGYARTKDLGGYKDQDLIGHGLSAKLAKDLGILTGYRDGTFRAQNLMTRAEAAVVMARLLELKPLDKGFRVTKVSGKAYDSSNTPLVEGMIIYPGEKVVTKDGGQVLLTADDTSTIRIGPFSFVELEQKTDNLATGESHTSIKVWAGKIFGRVQKLFDDKSTFKINTPIGVAGIRGTTFAVGVRDDGATNVAVYTGIVAVAKRGQQQDEVLVRFKEETNLAPGDDKPAKPKTVELSNLDSWGRNALEEALVEESEAVEAEIERNLNESQQNRLEEMLQDINDTLEKRQENQHNESTKDADDGSDGINSGNSNANSGINNSINGGSNNANSGNNTENNSTNNNANSGSINGINNGNGSPNIGNGNLNPGNAAGNSSANSGNKADTNNGNGVGNNKAK